MSWNMTAVSGWFSSVTAAQLPCGGAMNGGSPTSENGRAVPEWGNQLPFTVGWESVQPLRLPASKSPLTTVAAPALPGTSRAVQQASASRARFISVLQLQLAAEGLGCGTAAGRGERNFDLERELS